MVFDCTLSRAPKLDVLPDSVQQDTSEPASASAAAACTNAKEFVVDDRGNVAGGCKGVDAAGLHWVCYAGQRAVTEGIIVQALLGQHQDSPSHG